MYSLEELTTELEKVERDIVRKQERLEKAEVKHAEAVVIDNQKSTVLTRSDVVTTEADIIILKSKLWRLKDRKKTLEKWIEIEKEKQGSQPGDE